MTDVVVTVPQDFGLDKWIHEGDPAGAPDTGQEYFFRISSRPKVYPGDRVYIVYRGKLRGYAPLVRLHRDGNDIYLVRRGGAVACTTRFEVRGFQGFRYRWWQYAEEYAFPNWMTP